MDGRDNRCNPDGAPRLFLVAFSVWLLIHGRDLHVSRFSPHVLRRPAPSNYPTLTRLLSQEGLEGNYKVCVISCGTDGGQAAVTPEITEKGMRIKERSFLRVQITEGRWKSRQKPSARRNPSRFDGRCGKSPSG